MTHDRTFRRWICAVCAALSLGFAALDAAAREPGKLANVMILATGGTIAGTGASSTAARPARPLCSRSSAWPRSSSVRTPH